MADTPEKLLEKLDAGSQAVASNLTDALHGEGPTNAMTEAHGGAAEVHADPSALGLNATAWVSLAMLVFIGILIWKKVPAIIGGALDKKIAGIREQLDEASKLRAEAETLKAEYEAKMTAAAAEADQMRARAEEDAANILEQAKADATDLIKRRQKMAEDKIAAAERAAVESVRAKAVQAATSAAAALIADKHDAAADKGLVDAAIKGLGKVN